MSSTIIDHENNLRHTGISLKIGNSYITSDQSVTKIVEEHNKLEADGKTISTVWVGDNHMQYKEGESGRPEATATDKTILLEIGDHIDQQAVTDALHHVTQAESVLNPLGLAVIVKPTTNPQELTQA